MEKYYDLIVSLIKSNRRYPGCETLLDDIVADVYEHAEVILNTVTNESVVHSYLEKIVATSMITVPKRCGVKIERSKVEKIPSDIIQEQSVKEPESSDNEFEEVAQELEIVTDEEASLDTDTTIEEEVVDDEILSEIYDQGENLDEDDFSNVELSEEIMPEEAVEVEITADAAEEEDGSLEEGEPVEIQDEEDLSTIAEEPTEVIEEIESEDDLNDNSEPTVSDVDKTLVDKMINGVPSEEEILEVDSDIVEDVLADEIVAQDSDLNLNSEEELLQSDELSQTEDTLLDEVDNIEELSLNEENSLDMEESADETDTLPDEKIESLSEVFEDITEAETSESGFRVPSYDCFKYSPEQREFDEEVIISDIEELQSKHSDLDLFEIIRLKYKENLSVDEVASKLGMDDGVILDILNELANTVKD